MTTSRLGRAAILALIGVVVACATTLPAWRERDVRRVVTGHTVKRTDRSILVVRIDPLFLRRTDGDPTGFVRLVAELLLNPPRRVILESVVLEVAQSRLSTTDISAIAAQFAPSATTVDGLVAPYLRSLGNVTVAYPVSPGIGRRRPDSVFARFPAAVVGDAVDSTGVTAVAMSSSGTGEYLVPLLARPVPSAGSRTVVPAAALIVGVTRPGARSGMATSRAGRLHFAGAAIPVEQSVGLRVRYSRALLPGGAQVIRASDLVTGRVDPAVLKRRIVVIGVDGPGSQRVPAPVARGSVAPVYVNANAVNTLRTGNFLEASALAPQVAAGVVVAVLIGLLWAFAPWWAALLGSMIGALLWSRYVQFALERGELRSIFVVVGPVVVVSAVALAWHLVMIVQHRSRVASLFARYVPERVADRLMEGNLAEEIAAGRRGPVTALFVDLRGFTPLAAGLDPTDIRRLLDRYYEFVTARVLAEDGTVMQFVGDEVYAVFGAPLQREDHVAAALSVANAIQRDRHLLDAILMQDGLPPVRYGVGLHSGIAVAAHVGSSNRRQYAVIGDTVNIASRCCAAADADQIVATFSTVGESPPDGYDRLGQIRLKGVPDPVVLFRNGRGPLRVGSGDRTEI